MKKCYVVMAGNNIGGVFISRKMAEGYAKKALRQLIDLDVYIGELELDHVVVGNQVDEKKEYLEETQKILQEWLVEIDQRLEKIQ